MTGYNLMLFNKHINYVNTNKFSFLISGAKYKNIRQQHYFILYFYTVWRSENIFGTRIEILDSEDFNERNRAIQ